MKQGRKKLFLIILIIVVLFGYLINGFITKNYGLVAKAINKYKKLEKFDKLVRNHRINVIINIVVLTMIILYSFIARLLNIEIEKQNQFLGILVNLGFISSIIWFIQVLRLIIKIKL